MHKILWGIILFLFIISCTPRVGTELTDNSSVAPGIDFEEVNGLPTAGEVRTYVVTDSVFFHMAQYGDPLETKKEFEIEIQPMGEKEWQACYNINPLYYIDCACESSGNPLEKEGKFCLSYVYKGAGTFIITDAHSIFSQFEERLKNSESEELCPKSHRKLQGFLDKPKSLDKKFRYHLVNIHRYEGKNIPLDILSHRADVYEDIDFSKPSLISPGDSISRMVLGNSGGMEEELAVYKTKSISKDLVELRSIHGYKIWQNGMSWKLMGDLFVEDALDFYSIDSNNGDTQTQIRTKDGSFLVYFMDHSRANTPDMTHILIKEYRLKGIIVPPID